jgi:hypothetical protein
MANKLNIDLEGKYVVLVNDNIIYDGENTLVGSIPERVFFCRGGFGCSSITSGTLIGGILVCTGYDFAIRGYGNYIERLATEEEVKKAKELFEKNDKKEKAIV